MTKPWTKKDAIARANGNVRLQEILRIEPRMQVVLDLAKAIRRDETYHRIRTYIKLRNLCIPLVGWFAEREELRTSEDYMLVIGVIGDLLPQDESDIWPDGKPVKSKKAK